MSAQEENTSHLLQFLRYLQSKKKQKYVVAIDLVEQSSLKYHQQVQAQVKIDKTIKFCEAQVIDLGSNQEQRRPRRKKQKKSGIRLYKNSGILIEGLGVSMRTRKQKRADRLWDSQVQEICSFYSLTHPEQFVKKQSKSLPRQLKLLRK